jgi:hypothetical protein
MRYEAYRCEAELGWFVAPLAALALLREWE